MIVALHVIKGIRGTKINETNEKPFEFGWFQTHYP